LEVAIFDEPHKTTGPAGGAFADTLFEENISIRKRLFFTATPRHYDIRLLLAARLILEETFEGEVSDRIGRERYERADGEAKGYRNGYRLGRTPSPSRRTG
jgi:hypothetical protein